MEERRGDGRKKTHLLKSEKTIRLCILRTSHTSGTPRFEKKWGRYPGFRVSLLTASFPTPGRQWFASPFSSPVTVAGPRRILTGFPFFPSRGSASISR